MSKRERKPRAQSKSPTRCQQADIAQHRHVSMRPTVIRAAHTKWGSRETWGPVQFAQAELSAIFPDGPPPDIKGHARALVKAVNDRLGNNFDYQRKYPKGEVDHQTIARALENWRAG
jgi:hypothetical protein